jgi:hypothetical protein
MVDGFVNRFLEKILNLFPNRGAKGFRHTSEAFLMDGNGGLLG